MTELADILPIFSSYASNANEVDGRSSCLVGFGFNGLKFLVILFGSLFKKVSSNVYCQKVDNLI